MRRWLLLITCLVCASFKSWALSEVEIFGELGLSASVLTLPTGERGTSTFSVPNFFLNIVAPLKEENLLLVKLDGSEEKSMTSERFDLRVREAYLDLTSPFANAAELRMGLVPQIWQEAQSEIWSYRYLGKWAWGLTEKWNYLQPSDLGFSYMKNFASGSGDWAFSLVNGEGASEKETGPYKEGSLFFHYKWSDHWSVSMAYNLGHYQQYDTNVSAKERTQGLIVYEFSKQGRVGLEFMRAKDPVDAVTLYKMADEVNIASLSGGVASAQAASLFFVAPAGLRAEVFLRVDNLNAAEGVLGKDLQSGILGWGYQLTEDLKLALAFDHTRYGPEFAAGRRDKSRLEFAAQALF